ncbi:MAG: hypothetical protein JWM11_1892 [Planctomycetaceae bacterium]|nr:hypothetical protein [Planctomycetaceae bacterium]
MATQNQNVISASQAGLRHPQFSRRIALQAGALGLLGLGIDELAKLRAASDGDGTSASFGRAKSCIYIFLSGGLAQHESFDLKPSAPAEIRGEFTPIATETPGLEICEHLPLLARRSQHWAVVRSLTHGTNDHTRGHFYMLTGRSDVPIGFSGDRVARPSDWPSIASVAGDAARRSLTATAPARHLPTSIVLPERLVHWTGGVIPGAYGGLMGQQRDPFFIEASPYGDPFWRGAYPEYTFANESRKPPRAPDSRTYRAPNLTLPQGLDLNRLDSRVALLNGIDGQRRALEDAATRNYTHQRQAAVNLLADARVRQAFDVTHADERTQERYGRNSFGWSLLMAQRLVQAGVNLVQVNLGNNETWDTHGDAFPRLRDKLLPPTDRALSALLDDLHQTGLLESTLVVMAGEFGRTPKISTLPASFFGPGRDHWGAVQSVFFAGGGTRGGTVVGASDRDGAYPAGDPQTPESMAATIYHALGIAPSAAWLDGQNRPHQIYHAEPIAALV